MNYDRVFASQLHCHWCQDFRSRCTNLVRDILAPDERNVGNTWMSCEIVGTLRKADDTLDEHRTVVACVECSSDNLRKYEVLQQVCSLGLTTIALPEKRAEITGDMKLWNG